MKTQIVYEDNDIVVINKPAGLATQTARVGQPDVVSELKNYLRSPYLGIIHRLDQPVEGLLVFAKNKRAAAALSTQLQSTEGVLNKQYYAVFCGKPAAEKGRLVDYLRKDALGKAAVVPADTPGAGKALLSYHVLQTLTVGDDEISLADIQIDTGRFHQIRAQMSHSGMALLGDVKYGDGATLECSRRLGVKAVALCAYKLEFCHPVTGKDLSFHICPHGGIFSRFSLSFKE